MTQDEVQEWADEKHLDVREIQPYQYRLIDNFGEYVLDVYFKQKRGTIVRNAVMIWKKERWTTANSVEELSDLIK